MVFSAKPINPTIPRTCHEIGKQYSSMPPLRFDDPRVWQQLARAVGPNLHLDMSTTALAALTKVQHIPAILASNGASACTSKKFRHLANAPLSPKQHTRTQISWNAQPARQRRTHQHGTIAVWLAALGTNMPLSHSTSYFYTLGVKLTVPSTYSYLSFCASNALEAKRD